MNQKRNIDIEQGNFNENVRGDYIDQTKTQNVNITIGIDNDKSSDSDVSHQRKINSSQTSTYQEHITNLEDVSHKKMNTPQKTIFISHSSKDNAVVKKLIKLLLIIRVPDDAIFCTSFAEYGINLGDNFLNKIQDKLQNTSLVLFVLTENFYSSPFCLCEMGATWALTKNHIPIIIPPFKVDDIKGVIPLTQTCNIEDASQLNRLKNQIESDFQLTNTLRNGWERIRDDFIGEINENLEIEYGRRIKYGDVIRISHSPSGNNLHSHLIRYSEKDGGSGQQQVTAFRLKDRNDWWVVKEPDEIGEGRYKKKDNNKDGQEVENRDIIRLEHLETGENLHSHNGHSSPLTKQQEVTAFVWGNQKGIGDTNDNWEVVLEDGHIWQTGTKFKLIHTNTGIALHSHDHQYPSDQNQYEVTCLRNRFEKDNNDYWKVIEKKS